LQLFAIKIIKIPNVAMNRISVSGLNDRAELIKAGCKEITRNDITNFMLNFWLTTNARISEEIVKRTAEIVRVYIGEN